MSGRSLRQMMEDAPQNALSAARSREQLDPASLRRQLEKQQEEIHNLQGIVRELQAEIRGMRHSLSWKITKPLRAMSHRLPQTAALVQRMLDRSRDVLVRVLPKKASEILFDNRWPIAENIEEQIAAYNAARASSRRKIVFYTAVFGDYDNLLLPERIDPDIDYVCFTDRPRNDYGVWQMRSAPYHHPDPTRVARYVKTHPHELFPQHEVAVWLDANIILKGEVRRYIDKVRGAGAQIGLVPHPHRGCFYEEAEACKRLKKDAASIIDAQIDHYRRNGVPEGQPLFETGYMVVLLRNPQTAAALHAWWEQIEQFSRRDQLGLAWVISRFPDLKIAPVLPQGSSVRDHEDFAYFRHNFSRALVVPDRIRRLGTVTEPLNGVPFSRVKEERLQRLIGIPVDIVVCVHNALEDVRLCLQSARENLLPNHRIIIVNDLSNHETTTYLRSFATGDERVSLIENEENLGYTRSANRGLAAGTADFRIMLNSDTIVSPNWALKMLDAAMSGERIGIVGPLSNAAGAQSIPQVKNTGNNTAVNVLPDGLTPAELDLACEEWSFADLLPRVPLIHGFCFGIKKEVIDRIGLFDDENFKRYYGEENDYCFRALAAGFEFAVATNTFVFHRKSRSIDEEKRVVHMAEAWKRLRELYGTARIQLAYRQMEEHPLLERMRRQAASYFKEIQAKGASSSSGQR